MSNSPVRSGSRRTGPPSAHMSNINPDALALALFLALVNNRVVEYFARPIFHKFDLDTDWLLYISALTGLALAMLSRINLFPDDLWIDPFVGRVLTAIVIAGGANLIHDIVGQGKPRKATGETQARL